MNNQEWSVRAPAGVCGGCGAEFADGAAFASRLCFEAEAGYARHDYCAACAEQHQGDGAVSAWKTVFHKAAPVHETLKKETAESLLRQLVETHDPTKLDVIFVLAVMLERRRIFVERDVHLFEDGGKKRIYEHRGTGETFVIVDPQLRLTDLEHVQTEVVALLGGGDAAKPDAAKPVAEGAAPAAPAAETAGGGDAGPAGACST